LPRAARLNEDIAPEEQRRKVLVLSRRSHQAILHVALACDESDEAVEEEDFDQWDSN
jgi:hypothetical protein